MIAVANRNRNHALSAVLLSSFMRFPEFPLEKARHYLECLGRLWYIQIAPMGVRHCFEDHQFGIHPSVQQREMKAACLAKEDVAGSRDAKRRREASEIPKQGRQAWVLRICLPDIP